MPFTYLNSELGSRIQEARELLSASTKTELTVDAQRTVRGMVYIALFGAYEFIVHQAVSTAIAEANAHSFELREISWGLLHFALFRELDAYRSVGREKTWSRGLTLLRRTASADPAECHDVFPADGSYMKPSQVELIWSLFNLPGSPWPEPKFIGRIHEMQNARNHIAHGTASASTYGGRLSETEMLARIDDIEEVCSHLISTFQAALSSRVGFLR